METKTKVTLGAILLGTALTAVGGYIVLGNYSEGARTGVVSKFSHKGVIGCRTWEGDLSLEGIAGQDTTSGGRWSFSVNDENIVPQIQDALSTGHKVKLRYEQPFVVMPCQGDTEYRVVGVDLIKRSF